MCEIIRIIVDKVTGNPATSPDRVEEELKRYIDEKSKTQEELVSIDMPAPIYPLYNDRVQEPSPAGKKLIEIERGNIKPPRIETHKKTHQQNTQNDEPDPPPVWTPEGHREEMAQTGWEQTKHQAKILQKRDHS